MGGPCSDLMRLVASDVHLGLLPSCGQLCDTFSPIERPENSSLSESSRCETPSSSTVVLRSSRCSVASKASIAVNDESRGSREASEPER